MAANKKKFMIKVLAALKSENQLDKIDRAVLRSLANLFKRHNICRLWGDIPGLRGLAWEEIQQSSPALATLPVLLSRVTDHLVLGVLAKCANNS